MTAGSTSFSASVTVGYNREWARSFAADLERFGGPARYVNFLTEPNSVVESRAGYGQRNHELLVAAKRRYDPGNLFRLNQNIVP